MPQPFYNNDFSIKIMAEERITVKIPQTKKLYGPDGVEVLPVSAPRPLTPLTIEQVNLLSILIGNPDVSVAAKTLGVSRATAYRWASVPAFQTELMRLRDAVLVDAMTVVKTQSRRAVDKLAQLLDTPDEHLSRLVCNDVLNKALKAYEMECICRRLTVLERENRERNKRRPS